MPVNAATISIDVVNDLSNAAALKSLLETDKNAIFDIAGEVFEYAKKPVSQAAAAKASASISLSAPANWTLSNGIVFSLSAAASCSIGIDTVSETFAVAATLDATTTTNIVATPPTDKSYVYINIDLDFSIQGSGTGGGNVNGVGIAGAVSGGRSATLSFCQPVDATLSTSDAITLAFSQIVFPLEPTSTSAMPTGAISRVLFDGTFSAELDVTYGLGDHIFAAPSAAAALASIDNVESITSPSLEINAGATGSLTYTHTDHYALVVNKTAETMATAYLLRALSDDIGVTVGLNVGVTVTAASVAIDQSALQAVVKQVSGSDLLATAVAKAAAPANNKLTSSLNAKLASWASDVTGDIGLTASLSRQTNRTTLYAFDIDLAVASNLTTASWTALVNGDIAQALAAGGLKLQPGSGVSESLKRSSTIQFQFFNLFKSTTVTDFFNNASAELGPDGTIRLHNSFGDETNTTTNAAVSAIRIYFVVTATKDATGSVTATAAGLRIELSEAGMDRKGATFADTLALQPKQPTAAVAQQAIASYLGGHRGGDLTLVFDIKPSASINLTFTPYVGGNAGPLLHPEDQANWEIFKSATTQLIGDLSTLIAPLTYSDWITYNRACIDEADSTINPNRRQIGVIAAGVKTLAGTSAPQSAGYFMRASQGFMNLCEDLANLTTSAAEVTDVDQYNSLLSFLTLVITQDVYLQYGVPTAAALAHQLGLGNAKIVNTAEQASDGSSMTYTVTIS